MKNTKGKPCHFVTGFSTLLSSVVLVVFDEVIRMYATESMGFSIKMVVFISTTCHSIADAFCTAIIIHSSFFSLQYSFRKSCLTTEK